MNRQKTRIGKDDDKNKKKPVKVVFFDCFYRGYLLACILHICRKDSSVVSSELLKYHIIAHNMGGEVDSKEGFEMHILGGHVYLMRIFDFRKMAN